jgi:hypothetical protein
MAKGFPDALRSARAPFSCVDRRVGKSDVLGKMQLFGVRQSINYG